MTLRDPSKRFMGKPCKRGHSGERYVVGRKCVQCRADQRRGRHVVPDHRKAFVRAGSRLTENQALILEEMRAGLRSDLAVIMK